MAPAILGYSDDDVNSYVIESINKGVNTTLNTAEEPKLAELLLDIDQFAGGVKFARGGGEALQIAIRIARAYTKKEKYCLVAIMDGLIGIWQPT